MTTEFKIIEEPKRPLSMHPKKFAMWIFIASVVMLFASLTSGYIVRQAEGNWVYFDLPNLFYSTSVVIILSSVTMQLAYIAAKRDNIAKAKILITLTTVLGLVFLGGQFMAWKELIANNVFFVGNPSGSFLYVLTGLHGVHLVSAIIFLLIMLNSAFKNRINSGNLAPLEMCTTYWHFLGVLWLYLFVFLLLNR